MAITGNDPIRQDGKLIPDDPATFLATLTTALAAGEDATLRLAAVGASEGDVDVVTVVMDIDDDRTLISCTLTAAQVATVLGSSYRAGTSFARYRITSGTGDALVRMFAGNLLVESKWKGVPGVALTAAASEAQAALVAANAAQAAQAAAEAAADTAAGASDSGVAALVADSGSVTSAALSSTYVSSIMLPAPSGGDDTSALNAALASVVAYSKRVRVYARNGADYKISAPLVVYSNTELHMTGASVTLTAGSDCNMLTNRAVNAAAATAADAAIASGSADLTSATLAAVASPGQTVVVVDGLGSDVPLVADVASVAGSVLTLNRTAAATISTGTASLHTRDSDVRIIGGLWDRGANVGSYSDLHSLRFRHIDRLTIKDASITSTAGKYAISIGDATSFAVNRIAFATSSDGVHIHGPASDFTVSDLSGTTGDDTFAITPSDYANYNDTAGPVADGTIDGISGTTGSRAVTLIGGSPATSLARVSVSRVMSTSTNTAQPLVILGGDPAQATTTGGRMDDVTVANVTGTPATGMALVKYQGTNCGRLKLVNLRRDAASETSQIVHVAPSSASTIDELVIDGFEVLNSGATNFILASSLATITRMVIDRYRTSVGTGAGAGYLFRPDGTVTDLTIGSGRHAPGSGYMLSLGTTGAVITRATFDGAQIVGGGGFVQATGSTYTLSALSIIRCIATGASWLFDVGTTTDILIQGTRSASMGQGIANTRATGALTIRGAGNDLHWGSQGWAVASGGSISFRMVGTRPVIATGGVPTIAAGAGAGSSPTVSIAGSDLAGSITVTPGTGPSAGAQATVTLKSNPDATLRIGLTPTNAAAQAAGLYVSAKGSTSFTVSSANTPGASMTFDYTVSI